MNTEQEQVVDSADTTTSELQNSEDSYEQTNSDGESESEASSESSEQRSTETPEQRNARLKRQIERAAKKEGISVEEYLGLSRQEASQEGRQESNSPQIDEKYLILDLKTEGIRDAKEQEVVLNYIKESKYAGRDVDVATALKSSVVREDLANIRKSNSVPKPSSRTTGGSSQSIDYYVSQIKRGNMSLKDVPDAAMRKQIRSTRGLF